MLIATPLFMLTIFLGVGLYTNVFTAQNSNSVIRQNDDVTMTVGYDISYNPAEELIDVMMIPSDVISGLNTMFNSDRKPTIDSEDAKITKEINKEQYRELGIYALLLVAGLFFFIKTLQESFKRRTRWINTAYRVPEHIYARPTDNLAFEARRRYGGASKIGVDDIISIILSLSHKGYIRVEIEPGSDRITLVKLNNTTLTPMNYYERVFTERALKEEITTIDEVEIALVVGDKGKSIGLLKDMSNYLKSHTKVATPYNNKGTFYGFAMIVLYGIAVYVGSTGSLTLISGATMIALVVMVNICATIDTIFSDYELYDKDEDIIEAQKWAAYLNMLETIGQFERRDVQENILWGHLYADAASFGILDKVEDQLNFELPSKEQIDKRTLTQLTRQRGSMNRNIKKLQLVNFLESLFSR